MLNMRTYIYKVAGFPFAVELPDDIEADRLLPSFAPFRRESSEGGRTLFRFCAGTSLTQWADRGEVVEESDTDMGLMRLLRMEQGYKVELRCVKGGPLHLLHFDETVSLALAHVCWEDPHAGDAVCSMLRIVCSQAVLPFGGVAIHASAVALGGRAYLFLGRSGTGKSTHASKWLSCFGGCQLINDDNPILRLEDGRVVAYGSPWSGKTPCYRDLSFPVEAIVRLRQAKVNRLAPLAGAEAFLALLPSCSAIRTDGALCNALYDNLEQVAARVRLATLDCLPDEEAARVCLEGLSRQPETSQTNV